MRTNSGCSIFHTPHPPETTTTTITATQSILMRCSAVRIIHTFTHRPNRCRLKSHTLKQHASHMWKYSPLILQFTQHYPTNNKMKFILCLNNIRYIHTFMYTILYIYWYVFYSRAWFYKDIQYILLFIHIHIYIRHAYNTQHSLFERENFNHDDDGHGPLTVFRATCISKTVYSMLLTVFAFKPIVIRFWRISEWNECAVAKPYSKSFKEPIKLPNIDGPFAKWDFRRCFKLSKQVQPGYWIDAYCSRVLLVGTYCLEMMNL